MNLRALAVTLAALFVLCCAAGSAHAAAPQDDDQRIAFFLPLARAAWPDSPCAGREVFHTNANDAIDAMDAVDTTSDTHGKYSVARAQPATCEAWFRPGMSALEFCIAEVHELGHLAGYGHTENPLAVHAPTGPLADVMHSGDGLASYPPCDAATVESLWRQVRRQVLYEVPAPMASWHVACTSMRIRKPRCTASRPGALVRRFNIVHAEGMTLVDPQPLRRTR